MVKCASQSKTIDVIIRCGVSVKTFFSMSSNLLKTEEIDGHVRLNRIIDLFALVIYCDELILGNPTR